MASTKTVITLGDFCEAAGWPITMVPELFAALENKQLQELAAHEARMARCAGRPDAEVLPCVDEEGNEWGEVIARIPKTLLFNLADNPHFGWEGLRSEEGIKDILRDHPQCRVRTVSGRIVSGWTPGRRVVKRYPSKS